MWNFYNASGVAKTTQVPEYVTALPTSPVDGQEVYYAADATNGIIWHLRYRSGSSSSYKWEFVGGSALQSSVATAQTTTSGTYTDLATTGPSITLPLAGDFDIGIAVSLSSNGYGGNASFSVSGAAASTAADADGLLMVAVAVNVPETSSTVTRKTGLTAAAVTMRYRMTIGGTASFSNRRMWILPVRVG